MIDCVLQAVSCLHRVIQIQAAESARTDLKHQETRYKQKAQQALTTDNLVKRCETSMKPQDRMILARIDCSREI